MKSSSFLFVKLSIILSLFFGSIEIYARNSISGETFSFELEINGDLTEKYSISGLVNGSAEFVSSEVNSKCKINIRNRKVIRAAKLQLEVWPELNCLIEGQNKIYKFHRIFVPVQEIPQRHIITSIAPNLQKIEFVFTNISISKKK